MIQKDNLAGYSVITTAASPTVVAEYSIPDDGCGTWLFTLLGTSGSDSLILSYHGGFERVDGVLSLTADLDTEIENIPPALAGCTAVMTAVGDLLTVVFTGLPMTEIHVDCDGSIVRRFE